MCLGKEGCNHGVLATVAIIIMSGSSYRPNQGMGTVVVL